MKNILFIDDEPNVLAGLKRMLRSMRHEWHMEFAGGGEEALALMREREFDAVVSDMKMPQMDGAAFLDEVTRKYPKTARLILSGQAEKEAIMRSIGPSHQFLSKPCEADTLKTTVARVCHLVEVLRSDKLRALIAEVRTLPSIPELFQKLMEKVQDPDASLDEIGAIIQQDISMSAEILKLVNSAYFGLLRPVDSIADAVSFLGLDTTKTLVLGAGIFRALDTPADSKAAVQRLWTHSLTVAATARTIGEHEQLDKNTVADVYTAGMLHDLGKLILTTSDIVDYPAVQTYARTNNVALYDAEQAMLGETHAAVGGYLLGLWGFQAPVVQAVLHHHEPARSPDRALDPLCLVHVANAIADATDTDDDFNDLIDSDYLAAAGVNTKLEQWLAVCEQNAKEQAA